MSAHDAFSRVWLLVAVATTLLSGTATSDTFFAQLECPDSSCAKDCTASFFLQGACYPTTSSNSAMSWCDTAVLKMKVFPFTTNCTAYSYAQESPLDDCGRGAQNYVEYLCSNSKRFAALNSTSQGGRTSVATAAPIKSSRRVPVVIPDADVVVSSRALVGVVVGGGPRAGVMSVQFRHPLVSLWTLHRATASSSSLKANSRVQLRAMHLTAPGIHVAPYTVVDDVCAAGIVECAPRESHQLMPAFHAETSGAALNLVLDKLHLYVQSLLAKSNPLQMELVSVTSGKATVLLRLRL